MLIAMARKYKYMKKDFMDLDVSLRHLTIYLNFIGDRVEATNTLEITANKNLKELVLDADGLRIISVKSCEGPKDTGGRDLKHDYDKGDKKLKIVLEKPVKKGESFCVRTFTHCIPSDMILEGIYKDTTPKGAPQQYMSQCEMWGFQRIMPVIDDPRAKCTFTTTIEADARYTHLISVGDIDKKTNPDGKPVLKDNDKSRKVITYINDVPTSPYLFIAAAGTWDELVDKVKYPSGKEIRLEYLVPPGRKEEAKIPMEILKKSILWIREKQHYEYPFEVYRTITMNKSDSGGMENLGNTTIITDAALIDEHTLDGLLIYAYSVIPHEFEHNQCGGMVTMETPFDMWLNEGYTRSVERQFIEEHFDPVVARINEVDGLRSPLLGSLVMEDAGYAGRIVRVGFNDPDELIDAVTYDKSAEVIRMMRLIIGKEAFFRGKTEYFTKYQGGNANNDQFFGCFEKASGMDLSDFKKGWLYRIGYPKTAARTEYDEGRKEFRIAFSQDSKGEPFHIPIELALVGNDGKDIPGTEQVFCFKSRKAKLVIKDVREKPLFASINRDYSFYGTFHQEMSRDELIMQVESDPNHFNRLEAMRKLTDTQRIRLMKDSGAEIESWWLDLYGNVLKDNSLSNSMKSNLLVIDEQPYDRKYLAWYRERVIAKKKLMEAVSKRYGDIIVRDFRSLDTYKKGPLERGLKDRMLKTVLLGLIAVGDTPEAHEIILDHYKKATTATDRVAALAALNRSSSPERRKVLEEVYKKWHPHLSGYANYLRVVSSGANDDVWDMIEEEKKRDTMDLNQPTYARALIMPMAYNNKMVWTDRGMEWIRDSVLEFSERNVTLAARLLNTFQLVNQMKPDLKKDVQKNLRAIIKKSKNPVVVGQAKGYLGIG